MVVSLPDVHEVPSLVPHKPREVVQACHVNARDRGKGIGISKSLLTTKQAGDILRYVNRCLQRRMKGKSADGRKTEGGRCRQPTEVRGGTRADRGVWANGLEDLNGMDAPVNE